MDRTDAIQSAIIPTLQNLAFGFSVAAVIVGLAFVACNRHAIAVFHREGMNRLAADAAKQRAAAAARHPAGKARAAARSTAHDAA